MQFKVVPNQGAILFGICSKGLTKNINYVDIYCVSSFQRSGDESPARFAQSPVPMAVKEVLSTAKGTPFYVLTIAGKHGISEEKGKGEEEKAFLTEAEGGDKRETYEENVLIPDDLFVELRKV